ncbi:MAG: NAD(+)/NADH kinase [Lachnospiraceae bacterium]
MNKFSIIVNHTKSDSNDITGMIVNYLEDRGKECIFPVMSESGYIDPESIPDDVDCAIVVGGDGTLIRASGVLVFKDIPILGVNLGTLGYLTEVEVQHIRPAIDQLLNQDYLVENRMMLYGKVRGEQQEIALNDIVVTRSGSLRILAFILYVNGKYLNTYHADGIIISTPTGSTAYNFSAGGPIIEPTASMILVTPICSHALNNRSIIFSADDEVVIELGTRRDNFPDEGVVSFDGAELTHLASGDRLVVKRARETTKLVKLRKASFLETLREKMKGN